MTTVRDHAASSTPDRSGKGPADRDMGRPVLEVRGLWAGSEEHPILRSLDLTLDKAGIYVILGASGSGKSSFLRLLNRLDESLRGEIRVLGRDIRDYPVPELRRHVAMVFQNPVYLPGTVRDNLDIRKEFGHNALDEGEMKRLLSLAQLKESLLDRDVSVLSGGELQRLAFARSLLNDPEILLLDEPTSSLDGRNRESVLRTLRQLQADRDNTLLMVTHRPEDIEILNARAFYLDRGVFVQDPEAVKQRIAGEMDALQET